MCIFFEKYLVSSKKSSTFALAFEKQVCFDFLPEAPDIKIQIHLRGPNFFAPNRRIDEANWKIDTISVVQELK